MNILVNGSSVSRGPGSWPYVLQDHYSANIVNLSQVGSGNTYIHETTIAELSQRKYDLVLIQWTEAYRIDYKVKNTELFANSIYTSKYQSEHNDWPGKKIWPVNDQDYVEQDWIFGCGYIKNHEMGIMKTAFEDYYRFSGLPEQTYHKLMKMISLQSYLKVNNIPYVFCFTRHFKEFSRFDHLNKQIDRSRLSNTYLLDIATKNNYWTLSDNPGQFPHPGPEAQTLFAQAMIPYIDTVLK